VLHYQKGYVKKNDTLPGTTTDLNNVVVFHPEDREGLSFCRTFCIERKEFHVLQIFFICPQLTPPGWRRLRVKATLVDSGNRTHFISG
jgi:hypothetical protein